MTQIDKKFKVVSSDGGRPFIVDAVEAAIVSYESGVPAIGHSIPPRCGKSSIIALTAMELRAMGCPLVMVLTPWDFLTDQILEEDKLLDTLKYYAPDYSGELNTDRIKSIRSHKFYEREKEYAFLSVTNALVHFNRASVGKAVEFIFEQTNKRPTVIIDEAHLISIRIGSDNWGSTIKDLISKGAFVISLTGTPNTPDARDIPGFEYEEIDGTRKSVKQKVIDWSTHRVDEDGRRWAKSNEYEGVKFNQTIKAIVGVNISWRKAFDEGWMTRIDFKLYDPIVGRKSDDKLIKMSEVPIGELEVQDWVRTEAIMKKVLLDALQHLTTIMNHATNYGCPTLPRMLIVTSPDRKKHNENERKPEKGSNFHARKVASIISEILPTIDPPKGKRKISVETATSVTDDGQIDEDAENKIKRFTNGETDILIVKAIGLVGLDVPECKVMVDLSEFRHGPLKLQLMTRACTPWGSTGTNATKGEKWAKTVLASYFSIADAKHNDLKIRFKEIGGNNDHVPSSTMEKGLQTGEEEIVDTEDDKYEYAKEGHVSVSDINGDSDELNAEESAKVFAVRKKYPETAALPDVMLISLIRKGVFPVSLGEIEVAKDNVVPKAKIHNANASKKKTPKGFAKKAGSIVSKYIKYNPDDPDAGTRYGKAVSVLMSMAKNRDGFYGEMAELDDEDRLNRITGYLNEVEADFAKMVGRGEI